MKKFLALFAAAVVMTACTKKEEPAAEAPAAEAPADAAAAPEAPAADASSSSEAAK